MNTLLDFTVGPGMHALLALSWKGALFALIVGLTVLVLGRKLSSAWRHAFWLLVLVRFAVPDLGTSPLSMSRWLTAPVLAPSPSTSRFATQPAEPLAESPESVPAEPSPATEAAEAPVPSGDFAAVASTHLAAPWTSGQWLTFVWLAGVGLVSSVMVVLHLRMAHRVRRDWVEPSPDAWASLRAACAITGVKRVPELIVTGAVHAPALFGLLRPAILLPRELAASCDSASLHLILLHELAHLQRRDLWSQVAASLILALHWFNPAAWWAARRLRAEAEMAADAWTLRHTDAHEAHRMGEVLLGFAHRAATGWMMWFGVATVLGISENKRDLRRRIEALMDVARGRRPWWWMGLAVFAALAVMGLTKAPAQDVAKGAATANTTTVTGIVVDDGGKPIQGAVCSLKIGERDAFVVRKATSDAEGHFRFEGVAVPAKLSLSGYHDRYMDGDPKYLGFTSEEKQERRIVLPKATAWVSGTVTRKADGAPLRNAAVYLGPPLALPVPSRLKLASRKVTTDEAGRYRVAAWSMDKKEGSMIVDVPGMALTVTAFALKEGEVTVDQALEPDAGMSGTVVNAEGLPVPGATVCLSDKLFLLNGAINRMSASAEGDHFTDGIVYWLGKPQSDEHGGFSGRSVNIHPAGGQRLIVIHPTEGLQYVHSKDWKKGDTMKLERWNTLHGRLVDVDGKAVKGGEVTFTDNKSERDELGKTIFSLMCRSSATTDDEGRYKVDRVLPHSYDSMVSADGHVDFTKLNLGSGETREFNIRQRANTATARREQLRNMTQSVVAPPLDATKNPAQGAVKDVAQNLPKVAAQDAAKNVAKGNTTTVTGFVVDDEGKPIKGAVCALHITGPETFEVRKATCDAEGRFRFEGVAVPAKLKLSGRDDGYLDADPKFISFASEEQLERRIVLPRATAWVRGTVTRKADGAPVKDAQILFGARIVGGSPLLSLMPIVLKFPTRKVTTDEAGRYRVAPWSVEKKDLIAIVDAPGMAMTVTAFTLKEGELVLDQALEQDPGITGTVVNAEGQPVQGASLCLSVQSFFLNNGAMTPMTAAEGTDSFTNSNGYWLGKPQTDEKGGFSGRIVDARSTGDQRLVVIHPTEGVQYIPLKDWKKGGTMKLERWNTLHGKLMDVDGNAVKGGAVTFSDGRLERDDRGRPAFSLSNTSTVTTDNDGRYKAGRILPHSIDNMVSVDRQYNSSTRLNLKSGETQEFDIRLKAKEATVPNEKLRKMTGRVVAPAGTPLRSDDYDVVAYIVREGGKTAALYPDAQGRFETKPSEPGNYTIRVTVNPKDWKKFYPAASGGASMLVKLEPDAKQQGLDLGDFPLSAADFVLRPPPPTSASRSPRLNAVVAGPVKFTTWAGSAGRGTTREEPVTYDGRIAGDTPVDLLQQFIIRGTTADGSRYFSAAQTAGTESGKSIEGPLTFTPAVSVEGRMLGLPDDYAGDGWIVATMTVNGEVKPDTILKGTIPTMSWFAWAPVQRDGRFRFAALPRGNLTLEGFAHGRITRDPVNISTSVPVAITGSEAVVKVNLDTKPAVTKRVQFIRPDETPAAGATISMASESLSNSPVFGRRGHDVEPADAEAYARFKKATIPGHSATADADGYATLSNHTTGSATYLVEWTDPKTNVVYREKAFIAGSLRPQGPSVIKLTGRSE